ncbi:Methyl-viologen-reducing hydrogenase delta subunit [uncultured Desulfobacterium sp.]|uniref:Methyl-viologen-reducing hydrogenase delta subunit n=1 Tax=uncultured Desulfobacterium sp. TaxID=201089 RepID=A0A445MR43_9BACT|nr:Methyl-viologen-reducing hydrogenase delta subunit [uncultured Desulfobacterium sp.]
MKNNANKHAATGGENREKIGVFLCECGRKIAPKIDLKLLEKILSNDQIISHVMTLPYSCELPGIEKIREIVQDKHIGRVVVAGCEPRIILPKLERELEGFGIEKGRIDVVNIRGYVASVNQGDPSQLASKSAKLISSSAAYLDALIPSPKTRIEFKGPVMILGGGMATYSAAQELVRQKIETIIAVYTEDTEDVIRMLHESYPGKWDSHERLRAIINEVNESPYIKQITVGKLEKVRGVMGHYVVTFASEKDKPPLSYEVGAIIAALDGEMHNQGTDFGHDGKRVLCHTEMDEHIWLHGAPGHRVVFWINDLETERPYANLSARTAWNMAIYIREHNVFSRVSILYNNKIKILLSSAEQIMSRELGIEWIPYDGTIRPTVQDGFITYNDQEDQIEKELGWEQLVLSPLRHPGVEQLKVAQILGLHTDGSKFLERNPQMVRPEQVGLDRKFIAGSACEPCDLKETLRQGRRAAHKITELIGLANEGRLFAPSMVCTVDQGKCTGCGLCREICDCGGIAPVDGPGGNTPRVVDPMSCTGGGTCAAACPYHALSLQNNTTAQREARVAALARRLDENEVMGYGCNWGGVAAADHAGLRGMHYNSRFYLMPVGCIGQLDLSVMGRAFLEGANGLLLIGCPPEECHHSYGLDHAWSRVLLIKKMLDLIGIERERIALAHADLNKPDQYIKTVNSFVGIIDKMGPIKRNEMMEAKINDVYDTLNNSRVRWVLGASLRRPWETTYPSDQRSALAYDETLFDVLMEEFLRIRIINLLKKQPGVQQLQDISCSLGEERQQILSCLKDLTEEGIISRIFKDRIPYYSIRQE